MTNRPSMVAVSAAALPVLLVTVDWLKETDWLIPLSAFLDLRHCVM